MTATDGGEGPRTRAVPRPVLRASRDRPWERVELRAPTGRRGLGVALVVVLALAWLAVGRTGSSAHLVPKQPSVPTPAPTPAPSPPHSEPVLAVPSWVPRAIAATCRARGRAAARVVVDCEPGRGVVGVRYRRFASPAALRVAYAGLAPRVGGVGPSACANGAPEERAWSTAAAPAHAAGRFRCTRVDGRARIVWTSASTRVLAVASRADGDLRSLYEWWTTVPGPGASDNGASDNGASENGASENGAPDNTVR